MGEQGHQSGKNRLHAAGEQELEQGDCELADMLSSEWSPHWEGFSLWPFALTAPTRVWTRPHAVADLVATEGTSAGCLPLAFCSACLLSPCRSQLPSACVSGGPVSKFTSGWWVMSQGSGAYPIFSFHDSNWPVFLGLTAFLCPQTQRPAIFTIPPAIPALLRLMSRPVCWVPSNTKTPLVGKVYKTQHHPWRRLWKNFCKAHSQGRTSSGHLGSGVNFFGNRKLN